MKARLALSLATASLWHRRKVLALVCLTLTLSVTLLLGIQYLRTEVKQSFTSTISDTDLIIGARSGQWFDGVFDVVLGAGVAKKLNHAIDDKIVLSHGGGRTSFSNHKKSPFYDNRHS